MTLETYVDWNCRLLPYMRGSVADAQETLAAMLEMQNRFSISHICMMPDYDCSREPISHFLLRRAHAEKEITQLLSQAPDCRVKVKYAARACLLPDLHKIDNLEKLCITKERYLPIVMPMTAYADWIDLELNRLLYTAGFRRLIFTSFERCLILYPNEIVEKLLRIKDAVFQFHYKSLSDARVCELIRALLRQNRTVLLGTSADTLERVYQYEFCDAKSATNLLSVADYQTVLRRSRYFWDK